MFGDSGEDMNREPVCLGEVAGDELDSSLHERGNEVDVTSEAI